MKPILTGRITERLDMELVDVKLLSQAEFAASPFAPAGYKLKADDWKAFIEFKINHSMPVVAGPLQSGNYTAYHPGVIARSFESLIGQQMNLRHLVKSYNPKSIARDRIVGCIMGADYPMQGSWTVPSRKEDALPITAVASIFKAAEGVPKLLGDHLSNKQPWSVSIEVVFQIAEAGIYLPSLGTVTPMTELTEEMMLGIKRDKAGLRVGRLGGTGEQMVIAPGAVQGTVAYQGVGLTPNPAEEEAEILSITAERRKVSSSQSRQSGQSGSELTTRSELTTNSLLVLAKGTMAIAAEAVPLAMFPRGVWWLDASNARTLARVLKVHQEGEVKLGVMRRTAAPANPILHCVTRSGLSVLRSLRSVRAI